MCKSFKLDLIVKKLKEYPFTEKMLFCQVNSTRMMTPNSLDIFNTPNVVYPWELEVFAEFSLFADGNNPKRKINAIADDFVKMINTIRNYQHPYLKAQKNMSMSGFRSEWTRDYLPGQSKRKQRLWENYMASNRMIRIIFSRQNGTGQRLNGAGEIVYGICIFQKPIIMS